MTVVAVARLFLKFIYLLFLFLSRLLAASAGKENEFAVRDTNSLQDNNVHHRAGVGGTSRAPQFGGARLLLIAALITPCPVSVVSTLFSTNVNPPVSQSSCR